MLVENGSASKAEDRARTEFGFKRPRPRFLEKPGDSTYFRFEGHYGALLRQEAAKYSCLSDAEQPTDQEKQGYQPGLHQYYQVFAAWPQPPLGRGAVYRLGAPPERLLALKLNGGLFIRYPAVVVGVSLPLHFPAASSIGRGRSHRTINRKPATGRLDHSGAAVIIRQVWRSPVWAHLTVEWV
jgi:hypothetical protein